MRNRSIKRRPEDTADEIQVKDGESEDRKADSSRNHQLTCQIRNFVHRVGDVSLVDPPVCGCLFFSPNPQVIKN